MDGAGLHRETVERWKRYRKDCGCISARRDHNQVPLAGNGHLHRLGSWLELRPERLRLELAIASLVAYQTRLVGALAGRQVKTGAVVEEDRDLCGGDHEQHEQADCERELDQCLTSFAHSRPSVPISGVKTRNITSTRTGSAKNISAGTVVGARGCVIRSRELACQALRARWAE